MRTRSVLEQAGDWFEGYTTTRLSGVPVLALFDESGQEVASLSVGASGYVALARTPFYVESGGQVSDTGRIFSESGGVRGRRPERRQGRRMAEAAPGAGRTGNAEVRDLVTAEVSDELRDATRRNHTATHLLHAALRQGAGHPREAGGLARVAGSAPVRLRALRRRSPARRSTRSSAS